MPTSSPVRALPFGSALSRGRSTPRVVVVGAGMVGLSTAWHLQEHGLDVTVIDRSGVSAGSSWGNAGWLTPGLAAPLNEPAVVKFGVEALMDPDSPLFVSLKPDPNLVRFLVGFGARCTPKTWAKYLKQYVPINARSLEAFDELSQGGVAEPTHETDFIAAYLDAEYGDNLVTELELFKEAGLDVGYRELPRAEFASQAPLLSENIQRAIHLTEQRFIDPGAYVESLADSVRARGGSIEIGKNAKAFHHGPDGVTVEMWSGEPIAADAVVLATGAWLPTLAKALGVRTYVQAGRGYSFSVGVTEPSLRPVPTPYYFPRERVACTPIGDRFRVAGTMEFDSADAPLNPSRITAIKRSSQPLLRHLDWNDQADDWVGGRPVSTDAKPLIGATKVPRVFVNGGHGMWGITLGPISGKLLAEQIVTGRVPRELEPFNPLR